MTITEAISEIKDLKPNDFSDTQIIKWLSKLDHKIYNDLIITHTGKNFHNCFFKEYTDKTDINTRLLAEEPYAYGVYTSYLKSCIDRESDDDERYNQDTLEFNAAYQEYCAWYNTVHTPIHRTHRIRF